jgi:hypothetical protein
LGNAFAFEELDELLLSETEDLFAPQECIWRVDLHTIEILGILLIEKKGKTIFPIVPYGSLAIFDIIEKLDLLGFTKDLFSFSHGRTKKQGGKPDSRFYVQLNAQNSRLLVYTQVYQNLRHIRQRNLQIKPWPR